MFYRARGLSWCNSTPAGNRSTLRKLAGGDLAPGLVAYRAGEPVGWVSLGPRPAYERLAYSKLLAPLDDRPVWSIVCFVVSRAVRGQGVAGALLRGAIDYARAHDAHTLEAYPVAAERGRVLAASAYHGTQSMFEKEGFTVADVRRWNANAPLRPIMRLELA
jgi:GNAT superfamily N-acetyltransferase